MADMTPTEFALEGAEEKLWSEIKKFCRTNEHGPVFAAMDAVTAAAVANRDAVLAASTPPLELKPHDEAHLRAWAKKDPEQFHAVKSIASLLVEWDFARALVGKAHEELAKLRRQIEFALPSLPTTGRELTLEEMSAIKLRWSTGPEKYQNDADALIGCVIALRARAEHAETLYQEIFGGMPADRQTTHDRMRDALVLANENTAHERERAEKFRNALAHLLTMDDEPVSDTDILGGVEPFIASVRDIASKRDWFERRMEFFRDSPLIARDELRAEAEAELERVKTHCDAAIGVSAAAAAKALRDDRDQLARDLTAEREKYEMMKKAFDAEDNSTVAFANATVEKAREKLLAEKRAHADTAGRLSTLKELLNEVKLMFVGERMGGECTDAEATDIVARCDRAIGAPASEHIVAAAIEHKLGGVWSVPRPARHNHVIKLMQSRGRYDECERDHELGFITNTGRFVNRQEAMRVAVAAGQVQAGGASGLFSEDVW